ncbi:MAG: hypothetical protein KDG89_07670 [Geminicoccaceae bacterium]|nr:hypothetical protein [Geminicoccaceae bacterium]
MKFNIEIDCTPDEARRFLGFPDIAPMQERLLADMENRLREVVKGTDPKALLDQWLPFGAKGMDQWQSLWTQMATAAMGMPQGQGGGAGKGKKEP